MITKLVQEGIKKGEIIATSVNKARHWIDLPPRILFPTDFAQKAEQSQKSLDSNTLYSMKKKLIRWVWVA